MVKLGLIGYPLGHSFSRAYFNEKFRKEHLHDIAYENYPADDPEQILSLLRSDITGFNITIPYKTRILNYLNLIDTTALTIGAVNTIVRIGQYSWKGFNTDWIAFKRSLQNWYGDEPWPDRALVLGSGGAAKAIMYALSDLGIAYSTVSRQGNGDYLYEGVTKELIRQHHLVINATPIGMLPEADRAPAIPYEGLTEKHRLFDLVYNPPNTLFLAHGKQQGAHTMNGLSMLHLQAEHAWLIWKTYGKF